MMEFFYAQRVVAVLTEKAIERFLDGLVVSSGLKLDKSGSILDHLAKLVSSLYTPQSKTTISQSVTS